MSKLDPLLLKLPMTAYPLTVNLPEPVFQQLSRLAQLTQQPFETLVLQSIAGNLPPQPEQAPSGLQPALLQMQNFSVQELLAVAHEEILPHQQERHLDLLDKNADDRIAADERQELRDLRIQADQVMLRKAYAWALLRWHGHPLNLEPNQRYSITRKPVTNTPTAWDLLEESAGSLEMPSDWSQEHDHEHLNRI